MVVLTMPTSMRFDQVSFAQVRYDLVEVSDSNGAEAARLIGPPRWAMSLTSGDYLSGTESAAWDTMLLGLRGRVNVLYAWDPMNKQPSGSMRGTLTLNASAAAGAVTASITGTAGQAATTLLAGDWLQIGTGLGTSQLVKILADATADGGGVISVTFEPPLRAAYSGGAAVAWQRAGAYFRQQGDTIRWKYTRAQGASRGGFSVDLLETFS